MLHRPFLLLRAVAFLTGTALLVSLSACDALNAFVEDEDDPDVEIGHFRLTVDGAVTDTVEGKAVFGTTTYEDSSGNDYELFTLALTPDTTDVDAGTPSFFSQILRASDRPETGDYTFADVAPPIDHAAVSEEAFVFSFTTEDTTQTVIVASDSGTLTVTTSSAARFAGTFSVDASGLAYRHSESDEPQTGTVSIEGAFNAAGGTLPQQ